jgi:pimeloyl-ACP methyl ester carboxylesterase
MIRHFLALVLFTFGAVSIHPQPSLPSSFQAQTIHSPDHTVVVPDLRGIGRSSEPAVGYDKKTQAKDMRAVLISLGYDKTFVVAHDIRQHGGLRLRRDLSRQG